MSYTVVVFAILFYLFLRYRGNIFSAKSKTLLHTLKEVEDDSVICFKNIHFTSSTYFVMGGRSKNIYLLKNAILIIDVAAANVGSDDANDTGNYLFVRKKSKIPIDKNLFSHFGYIDNIVFDPNGRIKIMTMLFEQSMLKSIGFDTMGASSTLTLLTTPLKANEIKEKLQVMEIIK
ncbi:MAG TPA: hypothetical protein VN698_12050 [Bacteroidia bacterium]|nr:hypothetical protein [Bacteroidia bacterium]